MKWIKEHKIASLIMCVLLLINIIYIVKIVFSNEDDLKLGRVKIKEAEGVFNYQVVAKTIHPQQESTYLDIVYTNGQRESIPLDFSRTKQVVEFKNSLQLESLNLRGPEGLEERNNTNNHFRREYWSSQVKLLNSFSRPEFDYAIDEKGRVWFLFASRATTGVKLTVRLTVLNPDGSLAIDQEQLSRDDFYSCYPSISYSLASKTMHLIWNSYIEEDRENLYYTTYSDIDGKLVKSEPRLIEDGDAALIKGAFVKNSSDDQHVVILKELDNQTCFSLYHITTAGLKKVTDLGDGDDAYFTAVSVEDINFLKAADGSYLLVWADKSRRKGENYYLRFTGEGQVVVPRKMLYSYLSYAETTLHALTQDDKFYLFWSEMDTASTELNQVCTALYALDGRQIGKKVVLAGPDFVPISQITASLNQSGSIDVVWADGSLGKPRVNRDLHSLQLDKELKIQIPQYRITSDPADQLMPMLKHFNGSRYLFWHEFHDGAYGVYLKSTEPILVAAVNKEQQVENNLLDIFKVTFAFLYSLALQIFFLIPLNVLPLGGAFIFTLLVSFQRIKDLPVNWVSIFLTVLLLKFINLQYMSQLKNLTFRDSLIVVVCTFAAAITMFLVFNRGIKRLRLSFESKIFSLFGWIALDTIILIFVDYLQTLFI